MKFGLFYELQLPKPLDSDQWHPDDERRLVMETLEQIEFADKLGFDYVFEVEHDFLEEYAHSSARGRARSSEPAYQAYPAGPRHHPHAAGVQPPDPRGRAHRHAGPGLQRRVEFGTGEGGDTENTGFSIDVSRKKAMWEEATRESLKMMVQVPYEGCDGEFIKVPVRNIIPKPLQKPHPPVWVAASRRETMFVAARFGMGALGFGFETPEEAQERIERYWADPGGMYPDWLRHQSSSDSAGLPDVLSNQ